MTTSDWKDWIGAKTQVEMSKRLNNLKSQCNKKRVALVLGAGLSVPLGLSDWNGLLSNCFGTAMGDHLFSDSNTYKDDYEKLVIDCPGGMREALRRLQSKKADHIDAPSGKDALEQGQYYENSVKSHLKYVSSDTYYSMQQYLFLQLVKNSLQVQKPLLNGSGDANAEALCICSQMVAESKVKNVIIYNFDTLFEAHLEAIWGKVHDKDYLIHCDASKLGERNNRKANLYHVHGSIPTEISKREGDKSISYGIASSSIVFSEDSYYDIERYPYDWRNVVQSQLLFEKTCCFVGFSGDDYNFRRLVKLIPPTKDNQAGQFHYIFISIDSIVKDIKKATDESQNSSTMSTEELDTVQRLLINYYMELRETYLRTRQILPIWTTHEKLIEDLKYISCLP